MQKLSFYVPETHLEAVKSALFQAGAGKIGSYDCCAWQTKGTGQFRPLKGSTPFVGEKNKIHQEIEYLVEMVCEDNLVDAVLNALRESHPYETPAFTIVSVRGEF